MSFIGRGRVRLVLFHCSFLALKARSLSTTFIAPEEYRIEGERRLFQGQILDDNFQHSLYIFQDDLTHAYRLHAAVGNGELRRCPVWTAFVSELQMNSDTWIERHSRHRVRVKDLQIFVFCNEYRRKAQIRRHGEFELNFTHSAGDSDSEDAVRVIDVPPAQ
ncbi:hypothetical protein CJF30_00000510 [Rutstroemia sp. NJR-2017a BBW]|nr:hypothetical protein CJF30_00000510 [Rutstroemia sp. NJR-2017a BBW]